MKALATEIRAYRVLGSLALLHAAALVVSYQPLTAYASAGDTYNPLFLRLWCFVAALWFGWPIVLAFHRGRSALRVVAFGVPAALLFFPSFQFLRFEAPHALNLPTAVDLTPTSMWRYATAYQSGRADAKKDLAAGILAFEDYGFGAGSGQYIKILQDRYGIETRAVADCVVDQRIIAHAAGYNETSRPEIERRVGKPGLAALREEGARLDAEEEAERERRTKEFTRRITSLPPAGKVVSDAIHIYPKRAAGTDNVAEEEIARIVHAIEGLVAGAVPADAPADRLSVHVMLTRTATPTAQVWAPSSLTHMVSEKFRADLKTLPDVRPTRDTVSFNVQFSVRGAVNRKNTPRTPPLEVTSAPSASDS